MSDLPPASNKKPDGCVYPRCACNDSFCKERNPMSEEKAEYMTESTGEKPYIFGWSKDTRYWMVWERVGVTAIDVVCRCGTQEQAELICNALNTRPEPDAPESQGGGKCSAVWIDAENKQPSIKFWAEDQEQAERICDALSDSADVLSTPQQEAPVEAELVINRICGECNREFEVSLDRAGNVSKDLICNFMDCPHCGKRNDLWIMIKSALSSRSGGCCISRKSRERCLGLYLDKFGDTAGETAKELKQSLEQSNER